jgi:hypothetical protein
VLTKKDREAIHNRVAEWNDKLAPIDTVERSLVERSAIHCVRLERCVEVELSDLARRRRRASQRWETKQRKCVATFVGGIDPDPAAAVRGLQSLTRGCEWLLGQWQTLSDALDARGGWSIDQAEQAMRLLGKEPDAPYPGIEEVAALRCYLLAALVADESQSEDIVDEAEEPTVGEEPERVDHTSPLARIGADPDVLGPIPSPEDGRDGLKTLVAAEINRLKAHRDRVWQELDGPDHDDAQTRILIDTSPRGDRLLRYETASEVGMHRNLSLLVRLRKMEPDVATLQRFEKMGKTIGRIFNGTNWMPWSEYAGTDATDGSACATWSAQEQGSSPEEARPFTPTAAASPASPEPSPPAQQPAAPAAGAASPAPRSPAENEADFLATSDDTLRTWNDLKNRSRDRSNVAPEGARTERRDVADGGDRRNPADRT